MSETTDMARAAAAYIRKTVAATADIVRRNPSLRKEADMALENAASIDAVCAEADALERERDEARAERDANRTAAENAYAAQLAAESERDALRAELEKERAKVRTANLCDCARPYAAEHCGCNLGWFEIITTHNCPTCSGSGAVIVEGDKCDT